MQTLAVPYLGGMPPALGVGIGTLTAVMWHIGEAAGVDMDDRAVASGAGSGHVGAFNRNSVSDAFRVEP